MGPLPFVETGPSGGFVQAAEAGEVFFGGGVVAVVGDHSSKVEGKSGSDAAANLFRRGVENSRWQVGESAVAGEKVRAEEETEAFAVKTHVAVGVPRKMDRTQPLPDVEDIAVVQQPGRRERMEWQHRPSHLFQPARHA